MASYYCFTSIRLNSHELDILHLHVDSNLEEMNSNLITTWLLLLSIRDLEQLTMICL